MLRLQSQRVKPKGEPEGDFRALISRSGEAERVKVSVAGRLWACLCTFHGRDGHRHVCHLLRAISFSLSCDLFFSVSHNGELILMTLFAFTAP